MLRQRSKAGQSVQQLTDRRRPHGQSLGLQRRQAGLEQIIQGQAERGFTDFLHQHPHDGIHPLPIRHVLRAALPPSLPPSSEGADPLRRELRTLQLAPGRFLGLQPVPNHLAQHVAVVLLQLLQGHPLDLGWRQFPEDHGRHADRPFVHRHPGRRFPAPGQLTPGRLDELMERRLQTL